MSPRENKAHNAQCTQCILFQFDCSMKKSGSGVQAGTSHHSQFTSPFVKYNISYSGFPGSRTWSKHHEVGPSDFIKNQGYDCIIYLFFALRGASSQRKYDKNCLLGIGASSGQCLLAARRAYFKHRRWRETPCPQQPSCADQLPPQPGGRSGPTPKVHMEIGQYKNSLCVEEAQ